MSNIAKALDMLNPRSPVPRIMPPEVGGRCALPVFFFLFSSPSFECLLKRWMAYTLQHGFVVILKQMITDDWSEAQNPPNADNHRILGLA